MTSQQKSAFSLGDWLVHPDRGCIEKNGESVHLEPKVMSVLILLANKSGEVISKQVIVDEVWDGRPVSDIVVARCISVLRTALDDDSKEPRYIQTLPKRGYRLLPEAMGTDLESGKSEKSGFGWHWSAVGVLALATMTVLYFLGQDRQLSSKPIPKQSVAVLPFANLSGEEYQYFCDGISEQLVLALSEIPGLDIAARTSSFNQRSSTKSITAIAKELRVNSIIEGSVRREGDTVRVTAQVIDGASGYHKWSGSFDGRVEDTFELQERISKQVAEAIGGTEKSAVGDAMQLSRPNSFEAYDQYLIARFMLNRRDAKDLSRAIDMFKQSIQLDPDYGSSYLGLAYAYALSPSYLDVDPVVAYDSALQTLEAGIEADPKIEISGAGVRGFLHLKNHEWLAADEQFELALQSPIVESTSYLWYSQMMATVGRLEDSLRLAEIGLALDDSSPVANSRMAIANLWLGDNETARKYFDIADWLNINNPIHTESLALLLLREQDFDALTSLGTQIQVRSNARFHWLDNFIAATQDPGERDSAISKLDEAYANGQVSPRVAIVAMELLGATQLAVAILQDQISSNTGFELEIVFIDELTELRQHSAVLKAFDDLGYTQYWQEKNCAWQENRLKCTD
ncbi:MAG: winged helix-turn-helix domain-containing protein [Pseudomonadota bacterium]